MCSIYSSSYSNYLLFLFSAWIFKCLPGADTECDVVIRMPGLRSWRWRIGDSDGDQLMWGHGHTNNQRTQKVVRRLWCHQIAVMAGSGHWAVVPALPSPAPGHAPLSPVCNGRHISCVASDAAPVPTVTVHCAQLKSVLTHSHRCYL